MTTPEGAVATDVPGLLAESMRRNIDALPLEEEDTRFTIPRVPAYVRKNHEHYYEPQLVSIGPLHRDKEYLRPMEERKLFYLRDLLRRNNSNNLILGACFEKMRALELWTRSFYVQDLRNLCSEQFVEMMLLDGCFILEFVLKWCRGQADTLLRANWCLPLVRSDLILLENQIPFFVLQHLFDLLVPPAKLSLDQILIIYLTGGEKRSSPADEVYHLLHLYYYCWMPKPECRTYTPPCQRLLQRLISLSLSPLSCLLTQPRRKRGRKTIPCATELQEAGVTFKMKEDASNILEVTFRNGVLEIPLLAIEETTKSHYENLLRFEQWFGKDEHFSSYASFMVYLIHTERDVAILQQCGVIDSMLRNEQEVAGFFNHLSEGTFIGDEHYLAELFGEVNEYCESRWHNYKGLLRRDYFSNPWVIISLLCATVTLILTVLQTYSGLQVKGG